ncbi:MAG TPA: DUF2188 domain-containing protein [Algoriphagus sp.]|nr:DUF2188 domain-containing protein [Algoriphagus sp.]
MEIKPLSEELKKKFMESIEFNKDHVHVIEMMDGWAVKREGSKKILKTLPTKDSAMDLVHELKNVTKVYVHPTSGDFTIETMDNG